MNRVLVVAPHPDDETLGCGGTLLKHKMQGDKIIWLIMTDVRQEEGFSENFIRTRDEEIDAVGKLYQFDHIYRLALPATKLDILPLGQIVQKVSSIIKAESPDLIYLPYPGDVHSDHKIVFDSLAACTKSFRYPSIKKVLCYETLSETDFGINPDHNGFTPNFFVNIEEVIEKKIQIMKVFQSEMGIFPFPRSEQAIRALAMLRGVVCGSLAAESFIIVKEIW